MNLSRPARWAALGAAALAATAVAAPTGAATAKPHAKPVPTAQQQISRLDPGARAFTAPVVGASSGRQAYFVQFTGEGAADVAEQQGGSTRGAQAADSRRASIERTSDGAFASAKQADPQATSLFTVTNALPGAGMMLDPAGVAKVAGNPNVVKISRITTHTATNANVANLIHALNTWKYNGNTGRGVKVGIIDTGLDYTHADFGGPGTVAAYKAALADDTAFNWRSRIGARGQYKVMGGYDFAGDTYNADPTDPKTYQPVPHPDPDPLDCTDHGTHVAGTVAGYGVGANGKSYAGSYKSLTPAKLLKMDIGPGMAPMARLYPLRVFGCAGSTDLVIPALDRALDPNGDGNFNDHLDIVNLSLGSDYGPADDPENAVVDKLAQHGVLSVIAMGNNGDLTDTGGTPGNATSSLTAASSVDALQQRDGLKVNAPGSDAGIAAGQMSIAYDWPENGPTHAPVTGDVVTIPGDNADGCDKLSAADAAKVAGKIAWLEWDDNDATRRCGSVARSANVKAAGAIGSLFTSSLDVFNAGITGDPDIPVFQLPKAQTDRLRPAAEAGTLNVTFDGALQGTIKDITPSITDTLSSFSSRGPHGSLGVVKPDVTAVGDTVSSANVGTGNGVLTISGTSMATPVTAGTSALVKAAHPGWGPLKLKTAVMNTATHDLYTQPGRKGHMYAPARVGAGRVDARAAATTKVLAWSPGRNNPVSASFGVVPAPIDGGKVVKKLGVFVRNYNKNAHDYVLNYQGVNNSPGVTYSVSPAKLHVKGGGVRKATVTMTVDPTKLRHTIDPTMESTQTNVYFGDDEARQFVSDSSGRVLVHQAGKSAIRVPVYGAAKPTSHTTAAVDGDNVDISGTGISEDGSGAYNSLTSVLQLGATSDRLPECTDAADEADGCASLATDKAGDIQYVGAGSTNDGDNSLLYFGISTYHDWANVGNILIPYVDYDVDGDGKNDFETYVQNITGTDLLYAWTVDLASGDLVDLEPVNLELGDVDTNVFDSSVIMLPVFKGAIGLPTDGSSTPITYTAGTYSAYLGVDIDDADPATYDAGTPDVGTAAPLYEDLGDTSIALSGDRPADTKVLVLHFHGPSGARAQVLDAAASVPPAAKH